MTVHWDFPVAAFGVMNGLAVTAAALLTIGHVLTLPCLTVETRSATFMARENRQQRLWDLGTRQRIVKSLA
jgi:hypothetical protein